MALDIAKSIHVWSLDVENYEQVSDSDWHAEVLSTKRTMYGRTVGVYELYHVET